MMKKFMVVVNNKYIVAVESESNCGAEHVVLDNLANAKSALAYDIESGETRLDMFQEALETMVVTTIEKLKEKDRQAQIKKMLELNELAEERQHFENEVKRLEEQMVRMKANLEDTNERIKCAEKASGLKCRFYSQTELQ